MTATASDTDTTTVAAARRLPTVLAVLVVRGDEGALRGCLASLGAQTYPRMAVLAVDDASSDASHDILVDALGDGRVLRNDHPEGFARSVAGALATPVAAQADHLLLLHDDVALDPDAVSRLVEATMIPGVERVGIVGAKVVDWDRPRVLRDVGRSADRFGHPFSSLQPDELDQGQFDRVLDARLARGVAGARSVRRAARRRRRSRRVLASARRRLARRDDAARTRTPPRPGTGRWRPSLRRGPRGARHDREELLVVDADEGLRRRHPAHAGPPGLPDAVAPVRRSGRRHARVGMERR